MSGTFITMTPHTVSEKDIKINGIFFYIELTAVFIVITELAMYILCIHVQLHVHVICSFSLP